MFGKVGSRKGRSLILAIISLVLLVLIGSSASAAPNCKNISGKFSLQDVSGPQCLSPVGLCTTGTFSGALAGASTFTGSGLIASADSPTTGVFFLTGDTQFQTKDGTLSTKDAISLRNTAPGDFAGLSTLIAGTGEWAGATGSFQIFGTLPTSTGSGEGDYTGQICFP